jgi:hypothetical protein
MLALMGKVRVTIEVRDDVRRALAIRAAELNTSVGAVIDMLTLAHLQPQLAQARRAIEEAGGEPEPRPKGRPPKKKQ